MRYPFSWGRILVCLWVEVLVLNSASALPKRVPFKTSPYKRCFELLCLYYVTLLMHRNGFVEFVRLNHRHHLKAQLLWQRYGLKLQHRHIAFGTVIAQSPDWLNASISVYGKIRLASRSTAVFKLFGKLFGDF